MFCHSTDETQLLAIRIDLGCARDSPFLPRAIGQEVAPATPSMSRDEFVKYVQAFNTQDPKMFARYYAPDITFERRDHRFSRGREAYVKEYYAAHDGLTEVLNPQRILVDGNNIAMEANVDFVATKAQPAFVVQPLKAGDKLMVKLFLFYTIRDGTIAYVKSARWNPGQP